MKIGKVIRENRKKQKLTQEDVANFLGVSAPAVNKWENGISYPDITLLAPLARLLKTDVDTLLSFHEDLTDQEIEQIVEPIMEDIEKLGFERTVGKYQKVINEYSGCIKLVFNVAVKLNMFLAVQEEGVREKGRKQIDAWLELAADSKEPVLADAAAGLLCNRAIQDGDFDRAQNIIDRMYEPGMDKRALQANLYFAQGREEQVYEIYESMVYREAADLSTTLQQLVELRCRNGEFEKAQFLIQLIRLLTENFELAEYVTDMNVFSMACYQEDREKALTALENIAEGLKKERQEHFHLYEHCKFSQTAGNDGFRMMLKKLCEKSESLDFLRDDPEFQRICGML